MAKAKSIKTCSVDGCERPAKAKGLCNTHYERLRLRWSTDDPVRINTGQTCRVSQCAESAYQKGLCCKHYLRLRRYGSFELPVRKPRPDIKCTISGCETLIGRKGAKGMCSYHYNKLRERDVCKVGGCTNGVSGRGYCEKHLQRLLRNNCLDDPIWYTYDKYCAKEGCRRKTYSKGLCHRHYDQQYRVDNSEHLKKVHSEYSRNHLKELNKKHREYLGKHPEKERAWRIRRRFRKSAGPQHNGNDELHVYNLAKGKCAYCGKYLSFRAGHIDHRVPLAKGGNNGIGNLEWTCPQCNQGKSSKLLIEWLQERSISEQFFKVA